MRMTEIGWLADRAVSGEYYPKADFTLGQDAKTSALISTETGRRERIRVSEATVPSF